MIAQVRNVFRQYAQQGRIGGLFYFTWAAGAKQPDPFSVFRCNTLTAAGKLALTPM